MWSIPLYCSSTIINWVSSSQTEPKAMFRKRANSALDCRLQLSAMFEGMDIADRTIWLARAYCSNLGSKAETL